MLDTIDVKEFTKAEGNILGIIKKTNNLMLLKVRTNGTRQAFCHIDHKNMVFLVKLKCNS